MKIHDVTMAIRDGMPVHEGDPAVSLKRVARLEDGSPCNLSVYTMGSHTGTHVDPPYHFLEDGQRVDALSLDAMIGPAVVVETGGREIDAGFIEGLGIAGASRLIFKTRGELYAGGETAPGLMTADAAKALVSRGVRLVGVDGPSVEREGDGGYSVHKALLSGGVVLVEGLDLSGVGPGDYEVICLPLKVKDGDGAPARVVLREIS